MADKPKRKSLHDIIKEYKFADDPKKDYASHGKWIDSDNQSIVLNELLHPALEKLYIPVMDKIDEVFGKDMNGAVNKEDKLHDVLIHYMNKFFEDFHPRYAAMMKKHVKGLSKKEQFEIMAGRYDKLIGASRESGIAGIGALVARLKESEDAKVRDLKAAITTYVRGDGRDAPSHAQYLLGHLNGKLYQRLMAAHEHEYNSMVIDELVKTAPKGYVLNSNQRKRLLQADPEEMAQHHQRLITAKRSDRPYDQLQNYYRKEKKPASGEMKKAA